MLDNQQLDEKALVEQLKVGNQSAFTTLVEAYGEQVLNLCYRFLLQRQDAEDIAQEVFVEVFKSVKSYRNEAKLSTWLYRIAVSKCLDELRKQQRKKHFKAVGKMLGLEEVTDWLMGGTRPDKDLETKERFGNIEKALSILPDNQRIAFTLSKMEGYSNEEIAEIMDITQMAVEALVYRAKKKVGDELSKILKH